MSRSIVAALAFHSCSSVAAFVSSCSSYAAVGSSDCDDDSSVSRRAADDDDSLRPTDGTQRAAVGHLVLLCGASMAR